MIGTFAFFVLLPAAIAAGLMFGLGAWAPRKSMRFRMTVSALVAGLLPISLPIVVILFMQDSGTERWMIVAVLTVTALIVAAAIGLPVAWLVGKRIESKEERPAETFE